MGEDVAAEELQNFSERLQHCQDSLARTSGKSARIQVMTGAYCARSAPRLGFGV